MKRVLIILTSIATVLCILTAISGLVFHVKYYWDIPVAEGEPISFGDVVDGAAYFFNSIFAIVAIVSGLPLILVKRWRKVRFAVSCCLLAILVVVSYGPLHDLVYDWGRDGQTTFTPKNGDIIFHTSKSRQSQAIQEATGSSLSHMGIIYIQGGDAFVYEASGTMTLTPMQAWIEDGVGGRYTVRRLVDDDVYLTPKGLERMRIVGDALKDKKYDPCFEWSDDSIYCSELVWKIYFRALGLKVGELETLSDFDLSSPVVQDIIAIKADCRLDPDEVVISPKSMFESGLLETVHTE